MSNSAMRDVKQERVRPWPEPEEKEVKEVYQSLESLKDRIEKLDRLVKDELLVRLTPLLRDKEGDSGKDRPQGSCQISDELIDMDHNVENITELIEDALTRLQV